MIESVRKKINEFMYDVGCNAIKAFGDVFNGVHELSPLNYKMNTTEE